VDLCSIQVILKNAVATQINLSSTDGDMGILANHVPTVAQLLPGVIEVMGEKPLKYFGLCLVFSSL
jgi:F-type H+-transporting ATPase subunit delta